MRACVLVGFVVTLAVLTQGITEQGRNRIHSVHSECQSNPSTHVDEDVLEQFHKGQTVDQSVLGPHVLCMSTKLGLITQEGKINRANLKKALAHVISDETKLNDTVGKCAVNKDTPEETAIALERCFLDNIPHAHEHHHQHGHAHHH